jgi:hypothetical protein
VCEQHILVILTPKARATVVHKQPTSAL